DAEPVALRADRVMRHVGAVDEDALAEDPVGGRAAGGGGGGGVGGGGGGGEGVGELVAAVEAAVGDHQRQVALAAWERQRVVELVLDDPHPRQALPGVRGGV